MENFKFDLKATGGKIKPMNAANNGPVVGAVRTGSNNLELYKALEVTGAAYEQHYYSSNDAG